MSDDSNELSTSALPASVNGGSELTWKSSPIRELFIFRRRRRRTFNSSSWAPEKFAEEEDVENSVDLFCPSKVLRCITSAICCLSERGERGPECIMDDDDEEKLIFEEPLVNSDDRRAEDSAESASATTAIAAAERVGRSVW